MINITNKVIYLDNYFSQLTELASVNANGTYHIDTSRPVYMTAPADFREVFGYVEGIVFYPQFLSNLEAIDNDTASPKLSFSLMGARMTAYSPDNEANITYLQVIVALTPTSSIIQSVVGGEVSGQPYLPCLIAGTQITMADGTTKAIEDVKRGEEILSYDPANNQQVSAVVIGAYKTGSENKFDSYIFNDGSNLVIYDTHGYYDTNARTIRDFKAKGTYTAALNQEGDNVRVVSIRPYYHYGDKVNRYNLISSNNMYYANGILCGSKPVNKYSYAKRVGIKTPDDIKSILTADCDEYNAYNDLFQNPEYLKRTATLRTEYHDAHAAVVRKKEALANLDYKTIKVAEGVAGADTLEDVIPVKNRLRSEIDENREIYRDRLAQIKEIENEMRGDVREQTVFETCCTRDNNAFEEFKSWLNPESK